MNILDNFKKAARSASFHYADDSGKEWGIASSMVDVCKTLYIENPELRKEMDEQAKQELWADKFHKTIALPTLVAEMSEEDKIQAIADHKANIGKVDVTAGEWADSTDLTMLRLLGCDDWFSAWARDAREIRTQHRISKIKGEAQ